MSVGSRGPAVIDTGVFGARLTPSGGLLASRYRPVLEGRPAIISFVTVAELEYGARLAGWGPDRLQRLEREIARAEIVWPGPKAGLLRQAGADAVTTGLDEITTALRLAPPPAVRGGAVLSSGSAD